MIGTAIITSMERDGLVKVLLESVSNTPSSISNGKYGIYEKRDIRSAKVLSFISLNNPFAPKYLIFIIGGVIYVNKIAGVIMAILDSKNISYKVKTTINLPGHIKSYIKRNAR